MTGGIFAILDDISILMDDVAVATKLSLKKTTPILGDDLAVNAQKASGFAASRELPVLWAITKGSFRNKLIILPIAFILSAIAPALIAPILILGGLYLAFEGAEKVHEWIEEKILKKEHKKEKKEISEKDKIKSAILTDFILSIEIVVIALGTVLDEPFSIQIATVSLIAFIATVGVYGTVGVLVKMDDFGLFLVERSSEGRLKFKLGNFLISALPGVIKWLTVIGTVAMLLVAGGIFTHNIEYIHHIYEDTFHFLPALIFDMLLGVIIGYIVFILEQFVMHGLLKKGH